MRAKANGMADGPSNFVYFLRAKRLEMLPKGPTEEEARTLTEHSNYLAQLCQQGAVMLAGRTTNNDETTVGIVIINGSDETMARAVMENDPFVKSGLMNATLFPFRIVDKAK
jgi:uncharacterized protein YciI